MADTKITGLDANTAPALTDIMYLVDDPGGSPASQKITLQNLRRQLFPYAVAGGRLTLRSTVPVTTTDENNATTLYYTPYKGGQIGLYDGTAGWDVLDFTELSLNIAAYTASKPYDIWIYNNSGAAALDSTVWTNATTRATALTYQNGILVKNGATTRRYLGTIYVNSSGGKTDDSVTKRFVWNYYNRSLRRGAVTDNTVHNYTTGAYRSWNNDNTLRIEFVVGVIEDVVLLTLVAYMETTAAAIGYDTTSAEMSSGIGINLYQITALTRIGAAINHYPEIGYHYYQILEFAAAGATQNQVDEQASIWG